jgi:hypothetical protein
MVKELRDALVEAGASDVKADAAAAAVMERQEAFDRLVTKADLSDAKFDLIKWMAVMLVGQGAAVVTLLKVLP